MVLGNGNVVICLAPTRVCHSCLLLLGQQVSHDKACSDLLLRLQYMDGLATIEIVCGDVIKEYWRKMLSGCWTVREIIPGECVTVIRLLGGISTQVVLGQNV